jgi:hypothetical protein
MIDLEEHQHQMKCTDICEWCPDGQEEADLGGLFMRFIRKRISGSCKDSPDEGWTVEHWDLGDNFAVVLDPTASNLIAVDP